MRVRALSHALGVWAFLLLGGCASATMTSGRDIERTTLSAPPFVAGNRVAVAPGALLVLPVEWQPEGPGRTTRLSHAPGSPMVLLLADVQRALDSIVTRNALGPKGDALQGQGLQAPDVYSGCPSVLDAMCFDDAARRSMGEQHTRHQLEVRAGSRSWRNAVTAQLAATGTSHALLLTLEVGAFLPSVDRRGDRQIVQLGRDREVPLQNSGDVEQPVPVLQLTAVLIDRNGRAVRAAAEGLLAKGSGIRARILGATELITDTDIAELRAQSGTASASASASLSRTLELLLRDLGVNR
jgi:hypothetical protein